MRLSDIVKHLKHNTTFVPVFYRGNKIWVRVRVRMNQIASALTASESKHILRDFKEARLHFYTDDFAMLKRYKCFYASLKTF